MRSPVIPPILRRLRDAAAAAALVWALAGCASLNGPGVPPRPASFERRACGCATACARCSTVCAPGNCACGGAVSSAFDCPYWGCKILRPHAHSAPSSGPDEAGALGPGESLEIRGHVYRRAPDGSITVEERGK